MVVYIDVDLPDRPDIRALSDAEFRDFFNDLIRNLSEVNRMRKRAYRARKKNAESEPYSTQDILDLYGTDCHICGEPVDLTLPRHTGDVGWELGLHLDHVIPLSKGGTDLKSNVKPSHAICNMRKWNSLCLG